MALFRIGDDAPRLAQGAWVAESATVVGRVALGPESSVWYGAVLRGDNEWITLGERCNVQDAAVLHTDPGFPMTLGNDVTIGHQVMLHGCTIGDGTLIGIQAIVMNGAKIGRDCIVGAGALITEDKEFPDGSLIMGAPARVVRELPQDQVARLKLAAAHYVANARRHREQAVRIDEPARSDHRGPPVDDNAMRSA
jgi:carbonic anhydrase/acetyltransferase-like protein (isoleucine patch superfamily)